INIPARYDVSYESLFAGPVFYRYDNSIADRWIAAKHCFDFSQFNSKPVDLNLIVCPSDDLDISIRTVTCKITGLIKSSPSFPTKGISYELLCGEIWMIQVPPRGAGPADMQLANNTHRGGMIVLVENVDSSLWNWPSDGHIGHVFDGLRRHR